MTGGFATRRGGMGLGTMRPVALLLGKACLVPLAQAAPMLSLWSQSESVGVLEEEEGGTVEGADLWAYLGIAVALVLLGGAFAGLTIALMGQDETYLQVIATSGEGSERKHATKVLNLLKRGKHWVLVTLLLSNVITNETLPIVLDRSLGGGWPAVLSSTILIVIFGEVVPQSICVRYGLSIGSFMAPIVVVLMWIMCPVAWPTAKLLDYLLGEDHGTMYKKAGLKTLVQLHKTLGTTPNERLMEDEVTIINSVLDLKEKAVGDIMTPMGDVFTMSTDTVLDERMMDTILSQGYSRIPIYAPDNNRNFIGMLLVKMLITYDPEDGMRVRDFALATLPETAPFTSCLDIINFFQEGKSHMVLVSSFPGQDKGALGVVTLEDVIEELIGEEIIDESDVFVDVHKAIRRLAPAPKQKYGKRPSMDPIRSNESDVAASEDEPLLDESRKSSVTNGPPGTTFLMRRPSVPSSVSTKDTIKPAGGAVPVRSDASDIRQHLRHLGPSNAAAQPRPTKVTSVKIKPGVGTIPEGESTANAGGRLAPQRSHSMYVHPSNAGVEDRSDRLSESTNERTGLLVPGGKDASHGDGALMSGYGTAGSPSRQRGTSADRMSAREATRVAEEKAASSPTSKGNGVFAGRQQQDDQSPSRLQVPDKIVFGATEAPDADNDSPSRNRSTSRRAARSGSITETMIDVSGMKKLVLETASSSEGTENGEEGDARQGSSATSPTAQLERPQKTEQGSEDGNEEASKNGGNDGGAGGEGGKNKKKNRKKKAKKQQG